MDKHTQGTVFSCSGKYNISHLEMSAFADHHHRFCISLDAHRFEQHEQRDLLLGYTDKVKRDVSVASMKKIQREKERRGEEM